MRRAFPAQAEIRVAGKSKITKDRVPAVAGTSEPSCYELTD